MLRRWSIAGVAVGLILAVTQVAVAPAASAATYPTLAAVGVYSGPGDSNALLETIPANTGISIRCFVAGEIISGPYGSEDIWDALDSGGFVPDALIFTDSNGAVVPACPSDQFGVGQYPVAWTGGGGVQPMSGTSVSSGTDGSVLPDGLVVTVTCETSGQTLTDSANFTSGLWDQLTSGAYIPNVYIDTQVNGATPGLPACSQPSGGASGTGGGGGAGGGSGSPGGGGPGASTPATPASTQAATSNGGNTSSPSPQCQKPSGTYIPNDGGLSVPYALYDHYMWANGSPVVIDWAFFSQSASFVKYAKGLAVGQVGGYRNSPDTAMFYALGSFTVTRTSPSCYAIYDHYDFTPTSAIHKLPITIFTLPEWAYQLSGARDFDVRSAGTL